MALKRTLSSSSSASIATAERPVMSIESVASDWSSFDEEDPLNEEDGLLTDGQRSDSDSGGYSDAMKRRPWLVRHRVVEFIVSIAMLAMSGVVALMPVHSRAIPSMEVAISHLQTVYARDPTLSSKQMAETVPTTALIVSTTGVSILVNLYVNYGPPKTSTVRVIPHDARDFLLSLLQSIGISQVLTQFIKNLTGRFRPCFYDMCKWNYDVVWDGKSNLCQDSEWEKEARLSFPSGHASYAWSTLFLLTLYLLGRLRVNSDVECDSRLRGRKILKLFLCFLPTIGAMWVAVTRSVDNWHHYGDILAGSIIGALSASFGYSYNYSSIFHWEFAGVTHTESHAHRKARRSTEKLRAEHSISVIINRFNVELVLNNRSSPLAEEEKLPSPRFAESIRAAAMMTTPTMDQVPAATTSDSSHETSSNTARIQAWLGRYRVVEFSISVALLILAVVVSELPVNKREIPSIEVRISQTQVVYARDPTINNKKLHEQVSDFALVVGTTLIPIIVNLIINFLLPKIKTVRVIPHDTRDFVLSLLQSIGISQVLTQFIKNLTGRFRPSFYDMCKWNYDVVWDGKTNLCQDKKWEKQARLSFPSGHASYAWSTLFLMTLYLLGRSRLNCENRDETLLRGGRKTLKLFLCFLPTIGAMWVAITRSVDNWHHYADIVAGSILGALAACFSYSYNYGSIFHWNSAGMPLEELHARRQKKKMELSATKRDLLVHNTAPVSHDPRPSDSESIVQGNASQITKLPVMSSVSRADSIAISIK